MTSPHASVLDEGPIFWLGECGGRARLQLSRTQVFALQSASRAGEGSAAKKLCHEE
jgi:hypothetical protein